MTLNVHAQLCRVNTTHTGGGGVVQRGDEASFLDIISKHMHGTDSTRPVAGKVTEFAYETFSRTMTCEVLDGAVIVDVDRALKGERRVLRLLEAIVEGVAKAASRQWCLSLASVPQECECFSVSLPLFDCAFMCMCMCMCMRMCMCMCMCMFACICVCVYVCMCVCVYVFENA